MDGPILSRSAKVDIFVGEARFTAALTIDELILLEERRNCGPMVIFDRICNDTWRTEDIRQTIRFGLIGGGMDDERAFDLVNDYVREGRLAQYVKHAAKILKASMIGVEDDPLEGELEAPEIVTPTPED